MGPYRTLLNEGGLSLDILSMPIKFGLWIGKRVTRDEKMAGDLFEVVLKISGSCFLGVCLRGISCTPSTGVPLGRETAMQTRERSY